jgi:hypothetical protein
VEQRPTDTSHGTAVKPANADACVTDTPPFTSVDATSASLGGMLNEQSLAAMNTLGSMGIAAR